MQIVNKDLKTLRAQLSEKRIHLRVAANAKAWLAKHGYDKQLGARPLMRLIQESIRKPLAEAILFGALGAESGHVSITLDGNALRVHTKGKVARNDPVIDVKA